MFDLKLALEQTGLAVVVILFGIAVCRAVQKFVPMLVLPTFCQADVGSLMVSFMFFGMPGVDRVAAYTWIMRNVFGSVYFAALFAVPLISNGMLLVAMATARMVYKYKPTFLEKFRTNPNAPSPRDSSNQNVRDTYAALERTARVYIFQSAAVSTATFFLLQLKRLGTMPLPDDDPRMLAIMTSPSKLSPSIVYNLSLAVAYFMFVDFLTYLAHRLLHNPAFYWAHKLHHRFHDVSADSGLYSHPLDMLLTFILPGAVGALVFPVHMCSLWQIQFAAQLHLVYDHAGFSPDVHPQGWLLSPLPLARPAVAHDLHHRLTHYNFGTHYLVWDRLFGTLQTQALTMTITEKSVPATGIKRAGTWPA